LRDEDAVFEADINRELDSEIDFVGVIVTDDDSEFEDEGDDDCDIELEIEIVLDTEGVPVDVGV